MEPERRKLLLLVVLGLVLVVAVFRAWPRTADLAPDASNVQERSSRGGGRGAAGGAPDVRLEALSADRPVPADASRNLFHFGQRRATGSTATPVTEPALPPPPPPSPPPATTGAPVVPPVPPIALKFVGIIEAPQRGERIAVLSDGRNVVWAREGETVEGRYRVVRIGVESIEMTHLDGKGRQTIRLSGS